MDGASLRWNKLWVVYGPRRLVSMPNETIVRTIAEYIEFVDSVPAINDKEPKTYKSELVFRG